MKRSLIAAAILLPLSLSGCIVAVDRDGIEGFDGYHSDWEDKQQENRQKISRLELDMKQDIVMDRLGLPDFNESYRKGEDVYKVLFYRTHRNEGDGVTTKDECTQVVFKNGLLLGWGDTAYSQI